MPPSKRPGWGMEASIISPTSWGAIPRPSARGRRNWRGRTTWRPGASEKRGWTQTADRILGGPGGELRGGAEGPYRRRPDAGRGEVDEPVAAADRAPAHRDGHA